MGGRFFNVFWRDIVKPRKYGEKFSFDFRGVTRKFILGILEGKWFGITNSGQVVMFWRGQLRIVPIWYILFFEKSAKNDDFYDFFEPKTLDRSGLEVDFWDREVIFEKSSKIVKSIFWGHGLKSWDDFTIFRAILVSGDWFTAGVLDKKWQKWSKIITKNCF